jgi:AcrR family transcriptional regulator
VEHINKIKTDQSFFYGDGLMPKVSSDYEQAQKKRIIEGAAKIFAEYGYRQTTMDELCNRLELSKGVIYIYFKSKDELYTSTLEYIFNDRYALLLSVFAETDTFMEKLTKIIGCLGNLVSSYDKYAYNRLSVEGFLESDRIPGLLSVKTDSYKRFSKLLFDLLSQGQATNQINPELDISSMVTVMMATLDGLMMHSLVQGRDINPNKIQNVVLEMFSKILDFNLQDN